ncbi:MAG: hypothetical protein M1832_002105 [Thelocarpon impressellum]|nr:MAG: hypothetical protein M1832_002105 [Thelocarpon impressellum]
MPPKPSLPSHYFLTHNVTSQVFHATPLFLALVNLRPLLPGHVLVIPRRQPAPRLASLSPAELSDLFATAVRVGGVVERVYGASALNVAVQDGRAAGQSVAHAHVHVIPRRDGDVDGDRVHEMLEGEEGDVGNALRRRERGGGWPGVEEGARRDRSEEEMVAEAEMLRGEMDKGGEGEASQ